MDDIERIDLDSGRAVYKAFKDHQTFVDTDAALKDTQTWLTALIDKIDAAAGIQQAGRGGAGTIKDNLKADGTKTGQTWLKALKGLAVSTNDAALADKVKISPSAYENLPDNEWYQFNLVLLPLCTAHAASFAKYGRTVAEITSLTATNEAFKEAMPTPEAARNAVAKATKTLKEAIAEMNSRLREKTNALVEPYREVQEAFVVDFFKARTKPGK